MNTPSSVSRRLSDCLQAHSRGDFEGSLVHFFPALDKVSKRRRPKDGVGARIRSFLSDEEALISAIATGNIFKNISVQGVSFPDAIYKFGRTSIAHEGELDQRLTITHDGSLSIGEVWALPSSYITAMCVAVMSAPECIGERISGNATITIFGNQWQLNELWGANKKLKNSIAIAFQNPDIFTK